MNWIKDSILDLIILLVIFSLIFVENNIVVIVLYVYTALLLLGKILALFMPMLKRKADKTETPPWFHHLVYLLSISIFGYIQEYYLMGLWILVWVLSVATAPKLSKK
ncbi:MAG: hypothetical protein WC967_04185 [Balneolaceae bacterium]